jgi:folate-dependent phosphoribosylglycinamide formyltransferase PurN
VRTLKPFNASVVAYAGYMSIATKPLIDTFLGVNVHPADLSITNKLGKRTYTGDHAVRDAIEYGEPTLRSSTHIIEKVVDGGRILMISTPLKVTLGKDFDPDDKEQLNRVADEHQARLKEVGDWVIFPKTLELIAQGRYTQDNEGNLYFDEKQIPQGLYIEKLIN